MSISIIFSLKLRCIFNFAFKIHVLLGSY